MCGPVVDGCKHVAVGKKPEVILADEGNAVTHVMCKECADWFDDNVMVMDIDDLLATGRVGMLCLSCLNIEPTMPAPGFWRLSADGTYRPQAPN